MSFLNFLFKSSSQKEETTSLGPNGVPNHIAIIMDGNGRWAKARMLPRIEGHRQGAKTVRMVVENCRKFGVKYLTLYAFSSENWNRPQDEVSGLMKLFEYHLKSESEELLKNGVKLSMIGDKSKLPAHIVGAIDDIEIEWKDKVPELELFLAVSYGSRDEIVNAAKEIALKVKDGKLNSEEITHEVFRANMYAPLVPDPDLLIRTSGEFRISNYLLWQLAYSEIIVSQKMWPAFSKEDFAACIMEFSNRKRRFGLTAEQIV